MNKEYVEFLKMLSPFIILAISTILIPWIKRFYSSYISFFSLPTSKKIEAIEYINGYKKVVTPGKTKAQNNNKRL
uniref:hypothetical protein n=1 Tax=Enterobacter cloacae complex sp. TaxID=2027919 RepID=UPI001C0A91A8|nr:hypothetical protein [Enterobacter cloacae complex sp.]QVQ60276.1 hypothetical protein [Enterobacter cloacae complex sp.]